MIWVMILLLKWLELSLESFRIACLARMFKMWSSILSVFDVMLGLVTLGLVVPHLTSWPYLLAYALGYALGNFTGLAIFERVMKK